MYVLDGFQSERERERQREKEGEKEREVPKKLAARHRDRETVR